MKRTLALLLSLVLLLAPLGAGADAAGGSGPSLADIRGHDPRLVEPDRGAWLAEYDIRYVQSTGGVSIYLRYGPSTDYDHFDTVDEGEPVTVLAEQKEFALVIAPGERIGWCKCALIVHSYERYAPMPSLCDTCWTYCRGQTMGTTYTCYFYRNGSYTAYGFDGGSFSGTYYLSGRRLTLDKSIRFIWNGSEFVSSQKYEMQVGSGFYTIYPDSSQSYDYYDIYDACGRIVDGYYFVKLFNSCFSYGTEYVAVELMKVVGVAASDNLIFETTNKSYEFPLAKDCIVVDSSIVTDYGLRSRYYRTAGELLGNYRDTILVELLFENGALVQIEKFYIA